MTASPKSITRTTTVTNNNTGVTRSTSITKTGNKTTITKTTTIGKAKSVNSGGKSVTPKGGGRVTQPAKATGAVLGERWLVGPNDTRDLCGPVALANALLAATGVEATNAAIERLYARAGGIGDSGVPIPSLLHEMAATGLAGCRLASWSPLPTTEGAGLVLMELGHGLGVHAAALAGASAVMWGAEIALDDLAVTLTGAWSLTWHGQETPCRSST